MSDKTKPRRADLEDVLRLAAQGVHKVDLLGERGATLCSQNEIIAMAYVCAVFGVPAIKPGPRSLQHTSPDRKDPRDDH